MTCIGYYVHHHGRGHEHRFEAIARELGTDVRLVPISERRIPGGLHLPSDVPEGPPVDPDSRGLLHWAPVDAPESSRRLKVLVDWLDAERPAGVVVDVSIETLLACRLAGVRTIAVRQHGDRSDPAHRLGYGSAFRLLAPFPAEFETSTDPAVYGRTDYAGFINPFGATGRRGGCARVSSTSPAVTPHDVVVLWGRGGGHLSGRRLDAIAAAIDGRVICAGTDIWSVDDAPTSGTVVQLGWVPDPWTLLDRRPVVIGSSGNNCTALVAATGCPFVAVPQPRPFDEQVQLAETLEAVGVAAIAPVGDDPDAWREAIEQARCRSRRWERFASDVDGAAVAAASIRRHLT
ncbi:MAG: hypothetical protein ABIP17_07485 [Ilumatobacteraceae bacterium]